jgi:hypothetical protein
MSLAKEGIRLNHSVEVMRFTLIYDGSLPAQSAHDSRVAEKQAIRRQLHEQLLNLWQSKPILIHHYKSWLRMSKEQQDGAITNLGHFTVPFDRGAFRFIPLVTNRFKLVCELDILFLRAEPPGRLFTTNTGGDLDNRLKVLFDALRVPKGDNELPSTAVPGSDESPFFCLLENDDLITAVRLESERLYGTPTPKDRVRLVIKVTVKAQEYSHATLDIGND